MKCAVSGERASLFLLAVLLAAGWAAAHSKSDWQAPDEAKQLKNPVPVNDASIAAGKAIYADKCANCHGEKGDGQGEDADLYEPKPTGFTDAQVMNSMTDGEIFWKVTEGRRPMLSFKKKLTEEERWQAVNYLRTFAPKTDPKPSVPPKQKP